MIKKINSNIGPGQTDSQVDASLQKQNLRTDLRKVAKRIRKSARQTGWPNGKEFASTFVQIWARPKSTQVDTSRHKPTQVGGQTKRKLNASPKLASTCESVWPGLYHWTIE